MTGQERVPSGNEDADWMRRVFAEAAERYAELPAWARPVVTPPASPRPEPSP